MIKKATTCCLHENWAFVAFLFPTQPIKIQKNKPIPTSLLLKIFLLFLNFRPNNGFTYQLGGNSLSDLTEITMMFIL